MDALESSELKDWVDMAVSYAGWSAGKAGGWGGYRCPKRGRLCEETFSRQIISIYCVLQARSRSHEILLDANCAVRDEHFPIRNSAQTASTRYRSRPVCLLRK